MKHIKLLIVDDNQKWSEQYKQFFEDTDEFDVEIEPTGAGLLQHAREFKAEIILLDWELKYDAGFGALGSGISLANKIRAKEKDLDGIPIVIITAWDPADVTRHLDPNHEAKGIFAAYKAWDPERILAHVGNALYCWAKR